MSDRAVREDHDRGNQERGDRAPGDEGSNEEVGIGTYAVGLGLALLLTAASFVVAGTHVIWAPAIPAALIALAVAQMGVHLVFFLHITSGPDSTNNVLALAFGVLIVLLVIGGSIWIIGHLDRNMMPMNEVMDRMR
jgi:cytochrome o ubiquinol oxidase operon protein cyoD